MKQDKSLKNLVADAKKTPKDDTKEAIRAYMNGEDVTLTAHQTDTFERWQTVHSMMMKEGIITNVINAVASMYKVSSSTARRDVIAVNELFGSQNISIEIKRQRAANMSMEVYKRAVMAGDLSNQNRAISNLKSVDGLENAIPELQKAEAHLIYIYLDPRIEQILIDRFIPKHGNININTIIDADHEVIE
jgi:hypothetical protein